MHGLCLSIQSEDEVVLDSLSVLNQSYDGISISCRRTVKRVGGKEVGVAESLSRDQG